MSAQRQATGGMNAIPPGMGRRRFTRQVRRDAAAESRWGSGLAETRRTAIETALDDPDLRRRLAAGERLPRDFGYALDERIVELPWLLAAGLEGETLDAGSALNHDYVLERVIPQVSSLTITTFTDEERLEGMGARYVRADLRELPFDDASFDTIACVSTLEHIGMDNRHYGAVELPSRDPDAELARALRELGRVLRPGGRLLVTVPFGVPEDRGWLRQFDRAGLERIAGYFGAEPARLHVYRYGRLGWRRSGLRRAAHSRYHDYRADPHQPGDMAAAARAVACMELVRP